MLDVLNIEKAYGARRIINGISFQLRQGEACSVIGSSGEGKTTLLKCLNLLVPIDHGQIWLDGKIIAGDSTAEASSSADATDIRRRVGMVFQEWNLWPNLTVRENIALAPRYVRGLSRGEATILAEKLAARVQISDKLDAYPNSLSGGQKQRAAIARALAMDPDVLMLDEITSALDPILAAEVLDVMTELKADGRTLLLVTHHVDFARAVSDKILFLHAGRVWEEGPPEMLDSPQTQELQWFIQRVRKVH
jgi:ABC-type polar amino acid transport system ATPase subunit